MRIDLPQEAILALMEVEQRSGDWIIARGYGGLPVADPIALELRAKDLESALLRFKLALKDGLSAVPTSAEHT